MAGTISLLDVAVTETNPVKKTIYKGMFENRLPSLVEFLPIDNTPNFSPRTLHLTSPGTPTTRNLNAAAGSYTARWSDRQETVKIIHDKIVIDVELLEVDDYVGDPVEMRLSQYGVDLKALYNQLVVTGNPDTDDTQPAGLLYRFNNDATLTGQAVNASNLDVDANDANRLSWLDYIDQAIDLVGGKADLIGVNRQTYLKFRSALRALKLLDTTRDQFDREVMTYSGGKVVTPGQKPANQLSAATSGQIIPDDGTTSVFGTASTTPMLFINTAGEEGFRLLQKHGLKTKRIGVNPNSPDEYVVDARSTLGLFVPSKFCVSLLDGLNIT